MRKIAVFTGTRAEYGLLYWLMRDLQDDGELELQLLVSGAHLSPEFGETYQQIEKDGFFIDEKVEMLLSSDSRSGVAKSVGLGVIGFADALSRMSPDILVVLGDRFEALAVAQTAMLLGIPIAHLHGGEITEGAYDDSIRHAITKFSHLHFTATEAYRKRVIQLGEDPGRVFNFGAPGLDHLRRSDLLTKKDLTESLGFDLRAPYFLVTYHPVTLCEEPASVAFQELLDALDQFPEFQVIITYPNADDSGRQVIEMLEAYANQRPDRVLVTPSLGQERYLSAMKHCEAVIGNSSSGIIEAPSFHVPTVNIGPRQKGRLAAKSVFHCDEKKHQIVTTIKSSLDQLGVADPDFYANPYGDGRTSGKVLEQIKKSDFNRMKTFHNLEPAR